MRGVRGVGFQYADLLLKSPKRFPTLGFRHGLTVFAFTALTKTENSIG